MPESSRKGPLCRLKVVDLSRALAGPSATMYLADMGADVVKVEEPRRGDFGREAPPFQHGMSAYFASLNRGKRSLALDLKRPEGKEVLIRLAARADVLVENFSPGTMARLGLDYARLSPQNPRLIYCAISGFGQEGPAAHKHAYDLIIQGMSGAMSITGTPGGPPVRVGFSVSDLAGGLFGTVAILGALAERESSGQGQFLDLGLLQAQVALLENAFARYFASGDLPSPLGSRHPLTVPFQAFSTSDGSLVIAVVQDAEWARLCELLGLEGWATDPRFADQATRLRHHGEMEPVLAEIFQRRTTAEWLAALEEADVACAPLNTIAQAAQDPQLRATGAFVDVTSARGEVYRLVNFPARFSRTPARGRSYPPALGEHTAEVLEEWLGLSAPEIAALRDAGVVRAGEAR